MLVSPTQNSGVGGLSQRQGPTQLFWVPVEYRLYLPFADFLDASLELVTLEEDDENRLVDLVSLEIGESKNTQVNTHRLKWFV